jgi:hypothetical protein
MQQGRGLTESCSVFKHQVPVSPRPHCAIKLYSAGLVTNYDAHGFSSLSVSFAQIVDPSDVSFLN